MQDKLIDIKNEALAQILACQDPKVLEEIRVEYLGKSAGKQIAHNSAQYLLEEECGRAIRRV